MTNRKRNRNLDGLSGNDMKNAYDAIERYREGMKERKKKRFKDEVKELDNIEWIEVEWVGASRVSWEGIENALEIRAKDIAYIEGRAGQLIIETRDGDVFTYEPPYNEEIEIENVTHIDVVGDICGEHHSVELGHP